jgi:epidermal growth factor receptor substrate 15
MTHPTKRFLLGGLFFVLCLVLLIPQMTQAKEVTSNESSSELAQQFDLKDRQFGPYKESKKPPRYSDIDVVTYSQQKEALPEDKKNSFNPLTLIGNYFTDKADDMMGSVQDMMVSMFLMLVKTCFQFNIMMTNFVLTALHFSMSGDLMNYLISMLGSKIQDTAGIHNGKIGSTGTFGVLASLFAVISVFYAVYVFSFKRAPLEGMKSIVQPIVALTFAIIIIANFQTLTVQINTLSSNLTNSIATATQKNTEGTTKLNTLEDGVFKMMIHRPWLYLEFGTADESSLGSKRVENLLLYKPDEKKSALKKELKDYGNHMVLPSSIIDRMVYVGLFTTVNGFLSIPIWLLAFAFLGLQLYFIFMACLAPFVLVMCILPNQMGILWRYLAELTFPIGAKIVVSFLAMIMFTIMDIVYDIPLTGGLMGYFVSVYLQFVIMIILFVFRKRIMGLFSGARGLVRHVVDGSQRVTEPIKDKVDGGVQGTTRLAGAAIGGFAAGPQGLVVGSQVGSTVGDFMTGNRGLSELPKEAVKMANKGSSVAGKQGKNASPAKKNVASKENEVVSTVVEEKESNQQSASLPLGEETTETIATSPPDLHSLSELEGQDTIDTNLTTIHPEEEGMPPRDLHSLEEMEEASVPEVPPTSPSPDPSQKVDVSVPRSEESYEVPTSPQPVEATEPSRPLHSLEEKEADEEQKDLEKLQRKQQDEQLVGAPS